MRTLSLSLYKFVYEDFVSWIVEFSKLNPLSYVPVLVDGDIVISDSFAIILVSQIPNPSFVIAISGEIDIGLLEANGQ